MDKSFFLKIVLGNIYGNFSESEISVLNGSSGAFVALFRNKVYKVLDTENYQSEKELLLRLSAELSVFKKIYPCFVFLHEENWSHGVVVYQFFGQDSLESIIHGETEISGKSYSEVVITTCDKVLQILGAIYKETCRNGALKESFELVKFVKDVTTYNLEQIDMLSNSWNEKIKELAENCLGQAYIFSQSHNDLSVGNIFVFNSGPEVEVRFIDPRQSIPQFNHVMPFGNIAFDLISYEISILRKIFEVDDREKKVILGKVLDKIRNEKQIFIDSGVFTKELDKLAKIAWISSYLACDCDYCLSKDRIQVYEYMHQLAESFKE